VAGQNWDKICSDSISAIGSVQRSVVGVPLVAGRRVRLLQARLPVRRGPRGEAPPGRDRSGGVPVGSLSGPGRDRAGGLPAGLWSADPAQRRPGRRDAGVARHLPSHRA
jgi:hypothetical protein